MSPVWNPRAIDYEAGLDIYEPETGKVYTEEEARNAPREVQKRLTMRPRKIGCWVATLEELNHGK